MRIPVEIEDIEAMRHQAGIEDVELRREIRGLEVGDLVVVTLLSDTGSGAGEMWLARITTISGGAFRGKLARPVSPGPARHQAGSRVSFLSAHIHSVAKGRPSDR
jgi:hypothetical protein